jgi:uncharacterized phage protein (TIGR02218 family)
MPRRLYGAGCTHIFGDAMCGYNRTLGQNALGASTGYGQITVTAATGSNQAVIVCTGAVPTSYTEGTITGATGANARYSRTVASAGVIAANTIGLFKAWLFPVEIGDTFTVLPGCDHTSSTCNNTFNNLLRFGGFPYIPPPEYAV